MPDTRSGAPQLFYLQTVAPDGQPMELQFFANARQAATERTDAARALHLSNLAAVGDAFVRAAGRAALPSADLDALRRVLSAAGAG